MILGTAFVMRRLFQNFWEKWGRISTFAKSCVFWVLVGNVGSLQVEAQTYDQLVSRCAAVLESRRYTECIALATRAKAVDPKRYEAYALQSFAFYRTADVKNAEPLASIAMHLCPQDKKSSLEQQLASASRQRIKSGASVDTEDGELKAILLIVTEADKANTSTARRRLMQEFLNKSAVYLRTSPNEISLWVLRAVTALELQQEKVGREAGQKLRALDYPGKGDAKGLRLMASLENVAWLERVVRPAPSEVVATTISKAPTDSDKRKRWILDKLTEWGNLSREFNYSPRDEKGRPKGPATTTSIEIQIESASFDGDTLTFRETIKVDGGGSPRSVQLQLGSLEPAAIQIAKNTSLFGNDANDPPLWSVICNSRTKINFERQDLAEQFAAVIRQTVAQSGANQNKQ